METTRRYLPLVLGSLALLASFLLLWQVREVLLMLFGAILFALFLHALSDQLRAYLPLSNRASVLLVLLLLIALLVGTGWFFGPKIVQQAETLSDSLPNSVARLTDTLERRSWGRLLLQEATGPSTIIGQGDWLGRARSLFSNSFNAFAKLLVTLTIGIFLALDPSLYLRGVQHLIPPARRARSQKVLHVVGHALKGWLLGQSISMGMVGLLTTLGLWLIGVPLAMLLGLVAGLFEFIPNFGPALSSIPAILLALTESPQQALYVMLLYTAIQALEGYLILPLALQKTVDLPPALTIAGQLLLGSLLGPLGFVFAAPLLAVGMILIKMLYIGDVLGERIDLPSDHAVEGKPPRGLGPQEPA